MGNKNPVTRAAYVFVLHAESRTILTMVFAKTKVSLHSDTTFGKMLELSRKRVVHSKSHNEK